MQTQASSFEQLELKYCERCGGLWLRHQGSERVYCWVCAPHMREMAQPRARAAARLESPPRDFDLEGGILELFGTAKGGQA